IEVPKMVAIGNFKRAHLVVVVEYMLLGREREPYKNLPAGGSGQLKCLYCMFHWYAPSAGILEANRIARSWRRACDVFKAPIPICLSIGVDFDEGSVAAVSAQLGPTGPNRRETMARKIYSFVHLMV